MGGWRGSKGTGAASASAHTGPMALKQRFHALRPHLQLRLAALRLVGGDGRQEHASVGGVQGAAWLEELVPGHKHGVQHGLPQQEVALHFFGWVENGGRGF